MLANLVVIGAFLFSINKINNRRTNISIEEENNATVNSVTEEIKKKAT